MKAHFSLNLCSARFIVCEKTGRWAVALRRELGDAAALVFETRGRQSFWNELAASPASFAALELTSANVDAVQTLVYRVGRRFPAARVMILSRRELRQYEWLLREAGAIHVAYTTRRLNVAASLATRHLAAAPRIELPPRERILATLPWSAATKS